MGNVLEFPKQEKRRPRCSFPNEAPPEKRRPLLFGFLVVLSVAYLAVIAFVAYAMLLYLMG